MYHSIDHFILKVSGRPVNTQIDSVFKRTQSYSAF